MIFLKYQWFQNLTPTRIIFIITTAIVTISITELINKKIYIKQGRFFKFKEFWVYLIIIASLMSLAFVK